MSDLLDTILPAIPETFFRRLEERMNDGAAIAHQQALRTPPHLPAHRMRLGTTRYFERGEALRLSAEDVGLSHRFVTVNTHAEILVTSGPAQLGFGVPTRDLKGWHLLKPIEQIYAAYADRTGGVLDQAKPVLKRHRDRRGTTGQG